MLSGGIARNCSHSRSIPVLPKSSRSRDHVGKSVKEWGAARPLFGVGVGKVVIKIAAILWPEPAPPQTPSAWQYRDFGLSFPLEKWCANDAFGTTRGDGFDVDRFRHAISILRRTRGETEKCPCHNSRFRKLYPDCVDFSDQCIVCSQKSGKLICSTPKIVCITKRVAVHENEGFCEGKK